MNTAVGGVISHKVGRWGFAANDPRFNATMAGVGAGVTTVVVGGLGVAVGAATWPAVLVGAGVSALVSGAVAWGQDSVYKWLFNSGGTITSDGAPAQQPSGPVNYAAMTAGGVYYELGYGGRVWSGGSASAVVQSYVSYKYGDWPWGFSFEDSRVWFYIDNPSGNQGSAHWETISVGKYSTGAPASCEAGQVYSGGACIGVPGYKPPAPANVTNATVADAIANVPSAELAKPLSNEMLALAANAAWKSMSANTPNSLPWSASDPITPADVAAWKAANPSSVPTVGDAIGPVASPGSNAVPIAQPGSSPAPGPAPTPGTGAPVDLGPNPNTPPPSLAAIPTAHQILAPLLNLMPGLKSFTVPTHSASCPKPSFVALEKTYTIESHCTLVENNRALIEAAAMLCWALISVFIILRA
ncbi:hypothetical protein [Massilia sp. NR 4-1]|uniref:hypothetical protein n=1 Tax=Massilia sp. NR 4-1 TaxID=1678028 RepID=UPI0012371B29|nr:hypothetical protein [Massilia sp. NR 4-1]